MLSKKKQKKLKRQQKNKGKQIIQEKKQQQKKNQKDSQSQQQQQALQENNGDIDFNQIHEEGSEGKEKIDVTFLIAEIRQQYYHSMKTVLLRYSQLIGVTDSEIASQVLEKGNLGNVVVAEDDQEEEDQNQNQDDQNQQQNDQLNVYSVVTILPPQAKITNRVIKQASTSLENKKSSLQPKSFSKCQEILKNNKICSLLLSARLPNLPSFIVSESHQVFVSDLEQLKKTQPKNPIFSAQYILNVSEVQIVGNATKQLDDLIFAKFEDYEFCQKSLCWWVGENVKSQREKADLRRLYFLMRLKDYLSGVKNIKTYLEQQAQ